MASSKTHKHMDSPSEAQLRGLVDGKPVALRRLYLETHQLVLKTLPDVVISVDCDDAQIGYGARQYGYDGWGMAALSPYTKWVSLGFIRGPARRSGRIAGRHGCVGAAHQTPIARGAGGKTSGDSANAQSGY